MSAIKILGICGSPRRKSAYTALKAALDSASAADPNVECELVELRGKKFSLCVHCNQCLRKGSDRCTVFQDDMTPLYDKFYEADGVIVASPVYEMNVTAQTAAFFDRFRSAWKRRSRVLRAQGRRWTGGWRNAQRRTRDDGRCHQPLLPCAGNDACDWRQRHVHRCHALEPG